MRWRIKYVVLALVVIFGARLYVRSQAILFSSPDLALWGVESGALSHRLPVPDAGLCPNGMARNRRPSLVRGPAIVADGDHRRRLSLRRRRAGGRGADDSAAPSVFQLQAFVVLLGMAGLAVLLLSDRARQGLHRFAARHFKKAQHDSVRIWTLFSRSLANVTDQAGLCAVSAKLISETFDVLSVTLWLLDDETGQLVRRRFDRPRRSAQGRRRRSRRRRCRAAVSDGFARRGRRRSIWKQSTTHGPRSCGDSIRPRSQTAATACASRCEPGHTVSASSCWPIASTARPTRSRSWNCWRASAIRSRPCC